MKRLIVIFVFFCFLAGCTENAQQGDFEKEKSRSFKGLPVEVGTHGERGLPVELQVQQDMAIPVELQMPDNQQIPVKVAVQDDTLLPVEVKIRDDQILPVKFDAQDAVPVKIEMSRTIWTTIVVAGVVIFVIFIVICVAIVFLARSSRTALKILESTKAEESRK